MSDSTKDKPSYAPSKILKPKFSGRSVTKAVIPAAGLGTRFLPATKSVPKEMLTVVDAPIIFYVVEEAMNAGIHYIVLIQGRGKSAIEDFFDVSFELEDKLIKDNKYHLLERIQNIREKVEIISIRQKRPLGLGHAVLCAEPVVGQEPFALLLGDEIMAPAGPQQQNITAKLVQSYQEFGRSSVALMEVALQEVSKYGIAKFKEPLPEKLDITRAFEIAGFVEKPSLQEAPSCYALPGRYVLSADIFDQIRNTPSGKGGEIQLTDAMDRLTRQQPFLGRILTDRRFDAGDKLGYLKANIELALEHPELSEPFRRYLKESLFEKLK
jgi:UTP--glucose-1-phosphate uridylyltransferase